MGRVSGAHRPTQVPAHVGLIMDGNGRWAQQRGWPRTAGHQAGAEALIRTIEAAVDLEIKHLTVFAFSTENWKRSQTEVDTLIRLIRYYLETEAERMIRQGIRLRILGSPAGFEANTIEMLREIERTSDENTALQLNVALNYGGRQEVLHATRALTEKVAAGELDPEAISAATFDSYLFAPEIPEPDVIVRTSGERRLSNFLLWQAAYAELVFLDTLWPDFNAQDLREVMMTYSERTRRFGAVKGV
jgi:undecaprenyl diphosphate synthase